MIVYDLQCAKGHRFEGWFEDSRGYEEQQAKSLISCPVCESTEISRALSTFGIKSSSPKSPAGAENSEQLSVLRRQFTEFLDTHFDDVGCDFAKEALKIHYGAAEPRNIRGKSTSDEEKVLKEEGVQYLKFPVEPKPESDS